MRPCYGYNNVERTPNFRSVSEAAKWVFARRGGTMHVVAKEIYKVLNGERITAYGFLWFDEDDEYDDWDDERYE